MNAATMSTAKTTFENRSVFENWSSNPMPAIRTDADELTALNNQSLHSRTLDRIARRAERLWDNGYSSEEVSRSAHFVKVVVTTPDAARYLVTLSDVPADPAFGDHCACPSWQKYGECKHHLACLWKEQDRADAERADEKAAREEEMRDFFDTRFEIDRGW